MILVDSSVWVDYFNGIRSTETDFLDATLGIEPVAIGDLILAEVLQGFRSESDYQAAKSLLLGLTVFELLGQDLAVRTADNYRMLRRRGVTVRKTVDCIIATYCIERGLPLLYSDRDFDPFVKSLGLVSALPAT
ncbi:MAG: PIN domain nuclease [Gammaproteobacteria bacterium]|nr:PIN domain nuclease [Gammaproteobacteria bacterium]MBI5616785.1 PIN domain nuclease [Gammaproteobacteria bacterium]